MSERYDVVGEAERVVDRKINKDLTTAIMQAEEANKRPHTTHTRKKEIVSLINSIILHDGSQDYVGLADIDENGRIVIVGGLR